MDVVKAVETYISKLIAVPSAMKVLLLDTHTVCMSMALELGSQAFSTSDANCFVGFNTVDSAITPGLLDGSY
jgi:hypothetical protein